MSSPADPRDRLAQLSEKALRKMYLPHTIPVDEVDQEKKSQETPTIVIVKGGDKRSLGELLRGLVG